MIYRVFFDFLENNEPSSTFKSSGVYMPELGEDDVERVAREDFQRCYPLRTLISVIVKPL